MAPPKSKFELTGSAYPMETASFSRYWPKSVEPVTGVGSGQGPQGAQGPRTRQLERLEREHHKVGFQWTSMDFEQTSMASVYFFFYIVLFLPDGPWFCEVGSCPRLSKGRWRTFGHLAQALGSDGYGAFRSHGATPSSILMGCSLKKNHPFWVFPIVRKLDQLDGSNANWIQLDSAWTLPTVVDPALVVARSSGTDSCPMVIFTETLKYSTASNFNWHGWSKFYDIPCKLQRESFRISQNYGDAEVWTSFPFQSNGCLCWTRRYDGLKTSNGTSNDFNQ